MDIHHCRFVPFPPQPITALAFSHLSDLKKKTPVDLRLALGRGNGDIEIWNPSDGDWVQETSLRGSNGTTIEQLAWTQDTVHGDSEEKTPTYGPLRLFSTNGTTSITEWDLASRSTRRTVEGNFGDIWCFAAQPRSDRASFISSAPEVTSQHLAAGCADGTIVLFSTEDDDLRYLRVVHAAPIKKPKVLSLTWRDRSTVVAGYENSTIRVIDVQKRTLLRTMTLGKPVDRDTSVVWTLKCLPDGTILSGDSSGELKIWNKENFSLVQRLKTHQADIMDIACSANGDMIFTFGVDRRTVAYKPVAVQPGAMRQRWTQIMHRRFHEHDVKCAAAFESKEMSVVVSGGEDAKPIVAPLKRWQSDYHRSLPHLPQQQQLSCSKKSRLVLSWWDSDLLIYHVPPRSTSGDVALEAGPSCYYNYELLARLHLKTETHIQAAQICDSGSLISAATATGVKLFQVRRTALAGQTSLRTRPIDLPSSLRNYGARLVGFSPDGKWLYAVRADNTIVLAKVTMTESAKERPTVNDKTVKLVRISRTRATGYLQSYPSSIKHVVFSSDSRVIATGDLLGAIDVWILEGHEDITASEDQDGHFGSTSDSSSDSDSDDEDESYSPVIHGQKWVCNPAGGNLPYLDSAILTMCFKPQLTSPDQAHPEGNLGLHATRHNPHPVSHEQPTQNVRLIAVTATHKISEFNVLDCRLSEWSRRNPSSQLPTDFTKIKDRVMGCFWDCSHPETKEERLWMYGSNWMFMLDLSRDLPTPGTVNGVPVEKVGAIGKYNVMEPVENGKSMRKKKVVQHIHEDLIKSKKRKRNTGAGDEIRKGQGYVGLESTKKHPSNGDVKMIDVDRYGSPSSDKEGKDLDLLLARRRDENRLLGQDAPMTNGHIEEDSPSHVLGDREKKKEEKKDDDNDDDTNISDSAPTSRIHERPNYWHTFAYRSILGIVVMSDGSSARAHDTSDALVPTGENKANGADGHDNDTSPNELEIVIIERPMHDVELEPRFDGGQDWET